MQLRKRAAMAAAAAALAATTITGCRGSLDTEAVVMTVGDEEVTLGVANFYARMTQAQYETYYLSMMSSNGMTMTAEDMWNQEYEGETTEQTTKDGLLESLQNMYLISQHAEEYGVSLTEEEQDAISEAAAQFDEDNTDEAKEAVSGYKKDIEKYLELVTIQSKMDSPMREGVDEEVSDEEAAQKAMNYVFFSYTTTDESGNSAELSDDEKTALQTTAQNLSERVKAGEDMADVAEESSATVQEATFDGESTTYDADLIAAADALEEVGDVTDVIETDSGLYVAQLTSLLDRDATDARKDEIVEERRQEQYDSLLEEWRDATEISVDEKVWNKIDFIDQGVTIITSEEEDTSTDSSSSTDESTTDNGSADDGSSADDGTSENTDTSGDDTAE
ncbi:MAG: peptidylprolyl isomerase [Mediterraneibacter sp.]